MSAILASFTPSRAKMVVMFLGQIMFTVFAAYLLLAAEPGSLGFFRYAIWAALVLCPVYAVDLLLRILRRTPTIVATDQGLVFRTILGFSAPIPWAQIGEFRSVIMGKKPWLAIYLEDPRATFEAMPLGPRLMLAKSHSPGVPNISFREISLGASPEEAAKVLERVRAAQTPARAR